ncbi:hypothetical protein Droror1_Dr00016566 [Drosera rotundifolia]
MDRYGPNEGSRSDQTTDWEAPDGETGLEEPMWQLGLEGSNNDESYPERPGEPDCIYYLRKGFCGYGSRCRFNHPRDRPAMGVGVPGGAEYPERLGQPICQHYMRTGACKFGMSCKYHHPREGPGALSPVTLNFYGYPLRPGEKECTYYIKTGQCKFGGTCKFHHPQPSHPQLPATGTTTAMIPAPAPIATPGIYPQIPYPPTQQHGFVPGNWPVAGPPMMPPSYVQGPYGLVLISPNMVPLPSWNLYHQTPINALSSPTNQSTIGAGLHYSPVPTSATTYTESYQSLSASAGSSSSLQKEHSFPERPDQLECEYYMKTGDCKFGASCRYNHSPEWATSKAAPTCSYYSQHGYCKFGTTCKFDHPTGSTLSYSPSASSLSDMPVAPYPIGSSMGTLAPSSSSSDLQADSVPGSNKDIPTRMSSSWSTSSGSILSRSGPTQSSSPASSAPSSVAPPPTNSTLRQSDAHASS